MTDASDPDSSPAFSTLQNWIGGLAALLLVAGLTACQSGDDTGEDTDAPPVVDVTMVDYAFQAPDSIPSGWTTLKVANEGEEHHHFWLDRLPEGRTFEELQEAVIQPVDSLIQRLRAGEIDSVEVAKAFDRVRPEWGKAENLQRRGGMGLLAAGRTGRTTVKLEPGTYVMRCYIRNSDGRYHLHLGMVRPMTVTNEKTGAVPPTPDVTARIVDQKLHMEDAITAGPQVVKFWIDEEPAADADSAYYAYLVSLGDDTSIGTVKQWEFQNPAPTEFLGGVEYLDPDRTAYVMTDLSPGRYAWHWGYFRSEAPPYLKTFVVENREQH